MHMLGEMGEDRLRSDVDDAVVAPENHLSFLVLICKFSGLCESDGQGVSYSFSPSFFVTLNYRKYSPVWKSFFRSCGRTPTRYRFLNCFRIVCGRFQVIGIFCEVPMITMFWFQFLGHLVACIFHLVCRVGRFLTSPSADILKLLYSVLRSFAIRKNKYVNYSPDKPWKWTTDTWAFFSSSFLIFWKW